jgi:hypothetical protein
MAATAESHHATPEGQKPGGAWLEYDPTSGWQWVAGGKTVLTATPDATVAPAFGLASGCRILSGQGDPEDRVAAPQCSLYLRVAGEPGHTLYVKETGSGSTGWAAK